LKSSSVIISMSLREGPWLPRGGYEPLWFVGYAHMTPKEAVQAGRDLGADHVLGYHWATFRMTNEALDEPGQRFAAAVERDKIAADRFRSLLPGMVWLVESSGFVPVRQSRAVRCDGHQQCALQAT